MSTFIQLHILTTYAAANLNRDETGRPKTLRFGGAQRLRISSQSLKRAFRTSDIFAERLSGALGIRSTNVMKGLTASLRASGLPDDTIDARAEAILLKERLGKPRKSKRAKTEQLVHLGPDELGEIEALAGRLNSSPIDDLSDLQVLKSKPRAADIAMFGRMLADNPTYNVEAAVQVAHAFTVHRATVEDDFFTAVDDLNDPDTVHEGAGFLGVGHYGAGTFYLYVCISADLLLDNLSGDKDLAKAALAAMIEAATRVGPSGKQASFASRAEASYVLQEIGSSMPRSLAAAFQVPVGLDGEHDYLLASIKRLSRLREGFARAYGECFEARIVDVNEPNSETLADLITGAHAVIDGLNLA